MKSLNLVLMQRLFCLFAVVLALFMFLDELFPLPKTPGNAVQVVAADGKPLRIFPAPDGLYRYPVSMKEVSLVYIEVLLAYEDRWFWWHPGINIFAIARAAWLNMRNLKVVSGGSTLTMQVARLLDPHPRTFLGKIRQAFRALQLEWHFEKKEILGLYLKLAPFGGILAGVEAASRAFYGKPSLELSDAEAALLVALPQAPSRLRPDRYPALAKEARNKVLRRMAELNIWEKERVEAAFLESVAVPKYSQPLFAPLLARHLRGNSGVIKTTINSGLQSRLQNLLGEHVKNLPPAHSAALLVVDNETLSVRAYLGSGDFTDRSRFGHVDMIRAVRSPGSALKPFIYGMALDEGLIHSASLLADIPRQHGDYRPANFTDGFSGPVSAEEALRRSLNLPAVQVLEHLGPPFFASRLSGSGVFLKGPGGRDPNLSLALGGAGITLEDLVRLFASLARGGRVGQLRIKKNVELKERRLLSSGAAWITWKMLRVHPYRMGRLNGGSSWKLAWKTGTSHGFRDAWAMGVSPKWTIGVWTGRPDGTPSPGRAGRMAAAPILFRVYEMLREGRSKKAISKPLSVSREQICWPSGTAYSRPENRGGNCMRRLKAWDLDGAMPPTLSVTAENPGYGNVASFGIPKNSGQKNSKTCEERELNPSQLKLAFWPSRLEPWIKEEWRQVSRIAPTLSGCDLQVRSDPLQIISIRNNSVIQLPPFARNKIVVELIASGGLGKKHWFVNGKYVGEAEYGKRLLYKMSQLGFHQIVVIDEAGNSYMAKILVAGS